MSSDTPQELPQKDDVTLNEKLAFDYLRVLLGVISGDHELHLIMRAIQYANPVEYVHEPKNREDVIRREIFLTRATCYYRRKILHPFNSDNYEKINSIIKYEQYEITSLKQQLHILLYRGR